MKYVGSDKCVSCHRDEYHSYLLTSHSRALEPVQADQEPPDGGFTHPPSRRQYSVHRSNGRLWHAVAVELPGGKPLPIADCAMDLAIGSGRVGRTYLTRWNGFLVESPITWYASRRSWDVSPGVPYEGSNPIAFSRVIGEDCLYCHAGIVEPTEEGLRNLNIREHNIGCERCHGPGSLHVRLHESGEEADLTIVNPARLSRERTNAVCAQCHFDTAAVVEVRGRRRSDFRPGLRLRDFRVFYLLKSAGGSMRVAGHGAQMRRSRCYQASNKLTCLTCHDMHRAAKPASSLDYRDKCLTCHEPGHCGLTEDQRRAQQAQDNCIVCHMPKTPTEVAHVSLTHHRIGIHAPSNRLDANDVAGELVPWDDLEHLSAIDRNRCLGLAYHQLATTKAQPAQAEVYRGRAWDLLQEVRGQGLGDAEVDAALADLARRRNDYEAALTFARSALASGQDLPPFTRAQTLLIQGNLAMQAGRFEEAVACYEELTDILPHAGALYGLAVAQRMQGNPREALRAAQLAAELEPARPRSYHLLGELQRELGQDDAARDSFHRESLLRGASDRAIGPFSGGR